MLQAFIDSSLMSMLKAHIFNAHYLRATRRVAPRDSRKTSSAPWTILAFLEAFWAKFGDFSTGHKLKFKPLVGWQER